MDYPVRTVFHFVTMTENDYGETVESVLPGFVTGTRPATASFKAQMQAGLKLDGDQQYIWVRKNPNTTKIKLRDRVTFPTISGKWFKVIAIDQMLSNRDELMFMVDALE
jgi:hypothetical protein